MGNELYVITNAFRDMMEKGLRSGEDGVRDAFHWGADFMLGEIISEFSELDEVDNKTAFLLSLTNKLLQFSQALGEFAMNEKAAKDIDGAVAWKRANHQENA